MNQTSSIVEKINSQNGLSEFKSLIRKWDELSENLKNYPKGMPIVLPDLFLISKSGYGKTHCLKLLSEYLVEKSNLMDFYGDVTWFEFLLNYCKPSEPFKEIQRLMSEISNAAGFRNVYRGIVCIDVNEWCGHCEEKHFLDFLEYVSDNSDDWLVVLTATDKNPEKLEKLEMVISAFLRIEKITIEAPTVSDLMNYAEKMLLAYGFTLNSEAREILAETVGELGKSKYFDGYKTVKMLCIDIVYTALSSKQGGSEICAEIANEFSVKSSYVQRMRNKIENVKKIGFC